MSKITALNVNSHANLKVRKHAAIDAVKTQHVLNLRVQELTKAATGFPLFISQADEEGGWAVTAITSFEANSNLFVSSDNVWQAPFQPSALKTYPFFLKQSANDETQFDLSIDEESDAFSTESGSPIFGEDGLPVDAVQKISEMLLADVQNDVQTYRFLQFVESLGLLKPMDILIVHDDETSRTLTGINTIDEAKLRDLSSEDLANLNKRGCLGPLYAMLISLNHLNSMIFRHNSRSENKRILQVRMQEPNQEQNKA